LLLGQRLARFQLCQQGLHLRRQLRHQPPIAQAHRCVIQIVAFDQCLTQTLPAALLSRLLHLRLRHRHTLLAQMVVDTLVAPGGKGGEHGHDALDQFASQHLWAMQTQQTSPIASQPAPQPETDVGLRYVKPLGHLLLSDQGRPAIPRPPTAPGCRRDVQQVQKHDQQTLAKRVIARHRQGEMPTQGRLVTAICLTFDLDPGLFSFTHHAA
jgi:hypothetical protein